MSGMMTMGAGSSSSGYTGGIDPNQYLTDQDGNLILDQDGNPIPKQG